MMNLFGRNRGAGDAGELGEELAPVTTVSADVGVLRRTCR